MAVVRRCGVRPQGIVLVSFNYRLARFGFFAHPALSAEDPNAPVGNYGFMDQIAALQWVQRNIAAFGGNPADVTIFGESAGGRSVNAMLVSPLTEGAVPESDHRVRRGTRCAAADPRLAPGSAEAMGVEFAKSAGVTSATPAALRALSADVVRGPIGNTPPAFANAMIDGRVVVEDFIDTYKKGAQHQVPLIIGANSAEFGTGAVPEPEPVFRSLGDAKDKALAMYDGYGSRDPKLVGMEITSDMGMNNGTRYVARLIAKAGKPVFFYHFGYVTESGRATSPGRASRVRTGVRLRHPGFADDALDADRHQRRRSQDRETDERLLGAIREDRRSERRRRAALAAYTLQNDAVLEFTMNEGPVAREHFKASKMAFWDAAYDAGFVPIR